MQTANNPYMSLGSVMAGITLLQGGIGMLQVLVPVHLKAAHISTIEIGFVSACFSAGFLAGCLFAPSLIRAIGHIRAFSVFGGLITCMTLGFFLDANPVLWAILRMAGGACMAGMLSVSESWISSETQSSIRGRVLSVYMILYKSGQALGPVVLTVAEISGSKAFLVATALFSISLVPVALTRSGNPTPPSAQRMGILQVYKTAPVAIVGCLAVALGASGLNNMIPVYAQNIGMDASGAAILWSAFQLSVLFLQWPIGRASDKRDRRHILAFISAVVVGVSFVGFMMPMDLPLWVYMGFFWILGGGVLSLYPVLLSHASDFSEPENMVPLCSTLMLLYGLGMVFGPMMSAWLMTWLGPQGMFITNIICSGLFLIFILYRIGQRASPPLDERSLHVNVPPSSPVISALDPRAPHPDVDESILEAFGQGDDEEEAEMEKYTPSSR